MEVINYIVGISVIIFCVVLFPVCIVLFYCMAYDMVKYIFRDQIETLKEKIVKWLS